MRRSLEATSALFGVLLGPRVQTLQALGLRIDREATEVQSSLGLGHPAHAAGFRLWPKLSQNDQRDAMAANSVIQPALGPLDAVCSA